jgi:ribose-phosphate pyrophosphokinase
VVHLNGNKIFIDHIKKNKIEDLTIVAPDQGAVRRASDFCKAFPDATFAMINKKRIKPNEIHSMELVGDVNGRNVVIVDDMADTLGTMKKAAELLTEKGAKSVRCIATHGILSGKAIENLYSSQITELLVSDSIPFINEKDSSRNEGRGLKQGPPESTKFKVISCADIIAKTIWSLTNKKSIHEEINVI